MRTITRRHHNLLTVFTDPEARRIILGYDDLQARAFLNDYAEDQYNAGNLYGAAVLIHAGLYLRDRIGYEMEPPPTKLSIPVVMDGPA